MQQDKITDLPELAVAAPDDVLETTDVSASTSNKVQVQNLAPGVVAGLLDGSIPSQKLDLANHAAFFAPITGPAHNSYDFKTVTYGTPDYDVTSSLSSSTFTAPAKGLYNFSFNVQVDNPTSPTSNRFEFIILKNDAIICEGYADAVHSNHDPCVNMTIDQMLEVGDTVTVQGRQSGFPNQTGSGSFCGHMVRAVE